MGDDSRPHGFRFAVNVSAHLMRASAGVLLIAGLALLFAADVILPRVIPEFPAAGAWFGQLLGGAWLGVAALDWLSKGARLGGIYGRPIVLMNLILYFVSAIVLLKIALLPGASTVVGVSAIVFGAFAALFGWLMFRG